MGGAPRENAADCFGEWPCTGFLKRSTWLHFLANNGNSSKASSSPPEMPRNVVLRRYSLHSVSVAEMRRNHSLQRRRSFAISSGHTAGNLETSSARMVHKKLFV